MPDSQMTEPIHLRLAGRGLLPAEHYVDSGYPSAQLLVSSLASFGIALVTPMLPRYLTAGQGRCRVRPHRVFHRLRRPAGHLPARPRQQLLEPGRPAWHRHDRDHLREAHLRALPSTSPVHHLNVRAPAAHRAPRDVHQAQLAARAAQGTKDFEARYALRAGVEGTIRQSVAITDMRHARYRGLAKTRLEHANATAAVNLIRLHAWWNGHTLDRTRTSHLAHLELALAS
ncbi:MAG: transposase [Pseudonocardiales bacterium]|nr:transposase [Pseudonocardiales bacterium]